MKTNKYLMYMGAEINSTLGIGLSVFGSNGGRFAENNLFYGTFSFLFDPVVKVEIDFGAVCVGTDGKNRAGKITLSTTGEYGKEGFSFTLVYDGFSVDENQLSGSITSSGYTLNNDNNFEYTITSTDLLLTLAEDSSTILIVGHILMSGLKGLLQKILLLWY